MANGCNGISKRLSKLQDKLENGKLSPKQMKKVHANFESWMGVISAMRKDMEQAANHRLAQPESPAPAL